MKRGLLFMFMLVSTMMLAQINPCALGGHAHERTVGFKVDRLPDNFDLGTASENNRWLFSSLKSATYNSYQFLSADQGRYNSNFPEAEYVVRAPNGTESYYYQDRSKWYIVGRATLKKGAIEPVLVFFKIPLQACYPGYNKRSRAYGTSYEVTVSSEELIENFVVRENYRDSQDATGRLYLPQGIYDAYRVKREVGFQTELPAKHAPFALDGYTSYLFVDEVTEELLMEVRLDAAEQIETITYMADESDVPVRPAVGPNQFTLYPTTSFGDIRMDFVNFEAGTYYLEVYNIIGKKLWSKSYDITDDVTIKEDLSELSKGTYVYTVLDHHRNNLVTRRLAILNP